MNTERRLVKKMETKNERNEVHEGNCQNSFDLSTLNLGFRISGDRQADRASRTYCFGEVMQPLSG